MVKDKHKGAYCEMIAAAWLLKEGYEVFRNISQHGIADLVAFKDGNIFKFDVKFSEIRTRRLTNEQIDQNVKMIKVFLDGSCEIELNPLGAYVRGFANCKHCGKQFIKYREKSIFCSNRCKGNNFIKNKK